jgi:transposase-like protein
MPTNANPPAALSVKQRRFLAAYRETATITGAARDSGVDHKSHYRWRRECPAYAAAFDRTQHEAADVLEEEARRRAVKGVRTIRYGRDGKPLIDLATGEPYVEVRYSDRLLMALLRANAPEKFGGRVATTQQAAPAPLVTLYQLPENYGATSDDSRL